MTSNIPALVLPKMRPASLRSGQEASYFKTLEDLLDQIQSQVGITAGEVEGDSITALQEQITENADDIDILEGVSNTNANNIASNTLAINANAAGIGTNTSAIALLQAKVFDSVVVVKTASDFGTIDSSKTYYIDGEVDMGPTQIAVPSGGITLAGFGFNISKLTSSNNSYIMFTGATAGDIFIAGQGLTLTASGTGSSVFGCINSAGTSAVECNFVNFDNCTSLGYLDGYRQLLMRNVGMFGTDDGLEMRNTWTGGARITDFIVRDFGTSGTIFKSGTGLSIGTRFSMEANIDLPTGTSSIADFSPSDFDMDLSFQIDDSIFTRNGAIDIDDANYFPNTDQADVESNWLGNTGIRNTVIGGDWECTTESTTSIPSQSVFVKLAGTTTANDLDHMDAPTDNRLRDITSSPVDIEALAVIKIEQGSGAGDQIRVRIRIYRDATATFEEGRTVDAAVPNLPSLDNVVNLTLIDRMTLNENDYVELWISNEESGGGDMIMKEGSFFRVRRI